MPQAGLLREVGLPIHEVPETEECVGARRCKHIATQTIATYVAPTCRLGTLPVDRLHVSVQLSLLHPSRAFPLHLRTRTDLALDFSP